MAVTLPIINGSEGVWGSILNTAITDIDNRLINATDKNNTQDTTLTTYGDRITTLENKPAAEGKLLLTTSGSRPTPVVGQIVLETDTGYLYYCASVGGVATRVPFPGSYVAKLKQTTSQNLPTGSGTAITFNAADFNRLNGWTSGSRFVATVPGTYEFTGAVSFGANGTGYRGCIWVVNGANFNGTAAYGPPAPTTPVSASTVIVARPVTLGLGVGQYVELYGIQGSGSTLATDVGTTQQSGMQVKYLGYNGS